MRFQLSSDLDSNKVFLVKRSELEGRLDTAMVLYQKKIQKLKYNSKRLGSILKYNPQYGANEIGIDRQSYNEVRYIRITDIDDNGLLKDKIGKTANKIEDKYLLNFNDLLLARSGSVGRAYLHKESNQKNIFAGYLIRVVIDNLKANPDYIFSYMQLEFYNEWVNAIQRTVAQPNINAEEYKSLKIPMPPKAVQTEIVAKMDAAYASKKQSEEEAQRLLDGIDDYLLGELGIKLPEKKENTLQNRIFTGRLSEVSGGRFDAPVHHRRYTLETPKFPMTKLMDCVFMNPPTSFYDYPSETDTTFVPMGKVSDRYGEADISGCRMLAESGGYTKFQDNDLLWAKITPCMQNGKSAVVTDLKNEIGFGSTEFHVFRARSEIDIRYVHALLRLRSLRSHAVLYFSGSAGQQRVADEFFKKLRIPLPPLKKQTEIANHITAMRTQAKQLQQQAKAGLAQAKKEVEAMILGEDESKA